MVCPRPVALVVLLGAMLAMPTTSLLAKGSLSKVGTSGVGLREPIEVVDTESLEFLDMQGLMLIPDAIPKPGVVGPGYAVTRYAEGPSGKLIPSEAPNPIKRAVTHAIVGRAIEAGDMYLARER